MSPEFWHAMYVACAVAIGWTAHIGWRMLVDYHDSKKDHEILRLKRQVDQLQQMLGSKAENEEAPLPLTDAVEDAVEQAAERPRRRRSPAKAVITPLQPRKINTANVPRDIPQADLGRMQAQLNAFGAARTIYSGEKKVWM